MRQHACHHLPDSKEVDAELLRRAALSTRHIGDVMQRNVHVLTQTATLLDAARALCTGACHSLPIIAADGRLVGIVTSRDVRRPGELTVASATRLRR
jgi:CBS domain-containing protein